MVCREHGCGPFGNSLKTSCGPLSEVERDTVATLSSTYVVLVNAKLQQAGSVYGFRERRNVGELKMRKRERRGELA